MDIRFKTVSYSDNREKIKRHLSSLPSAIDSFLEEHIAASTHYDVEIGGTVAGFQSIHKGTLITLFHLDSAFGRFGQSVYGQTRKCENVQSAFVSTCDEFFLSHALDDYRELTKQAYFFALAVSDTYPTVAPEFSLHPASLEDAELIRAESGDFFSNIEGHTARNELYLTRRNEECVGFGVRVRSELVAETASIGMYTIERCRQCGVGKATLGLLIRECQREGLRPVAGCWYYNHLSKRTLESAGMFSQTRLLRIHY